jgi:hypothetical protein
LQPALKAITSWSLGPDAALRALITASVTTGWIADNTKASNRGMTMNEPSSVFAVLKTVLARQASRLVIQKDGPREYTLVTKSPSPFPQHKGQPMWFGAVKIGKSYVSYHLMPLYMNPTLTNTMTPALKKRMQGKSCFNFKTAPDPTTLGELERLTTTAVDYWADQNWL